MVDRLGPTKDLLKLITMLVGYKASGVTLDEIAATLGVSRRTAHRYMNAVQELETGLDHRLAEDGKTKLWYLPSAATRIPPVSAEQLSSLNAIASFMRSQGHEEYANTLADLRDTLQAGLDRSTLLRIDPDLEVLDASVEVTHRPGPRTSFDPAIRSQILNAILQEKQVSFSYTDIRGIKKSKKTVSPLAVVVGPRLYLVAFDTSAKGIRNYALTGIENIEVLKDATDKQDFDVKSFVRQSFGAFHDGIFEDWTLRFKPEAAHELSQYQFHPSQVRKTLPSGEIEISFRCESIREVAYECFRWSEHLTAIGPAALRDMVQEIVASMEAACREGERDAVAGDVQACSGVPNI